MPPQDTERDNTGGMLWALLSVLTASAMTIGIRLISLDLNSRIIVFWRFALTLVLVLGAIMIFSNLRKKLQFTQPYRHLWRGILVTIATHMGFYSITQIPLATVSVLFFTAPIFASIFGVIIHNEPIGPRRIIAILLGFVGAIIILRPGVIELEWGVIAALVSSITFAGVLTMSRNLAQVDGSFSTFFSANVITTVLTIPIVVPIFEVPDTPYLWICILALVAFGFGRQIADIRSYTLADAAVIAPISYLRLIFFRGRSDISIIQKFQTGTQLSALQSSSPHPFTSPTVRHDCKKSNRFTCR